MKKHILIFGLALLSVFNVSAQQSEVFIKDGTALGGYDPLAYFNEGKPVKGNEQLSLKWNDATWLFSNKQNLDSFRTAPEKFAPKYGGYCAYGMSEGHKAPTDPEAWSIVDGKLYLNYNPKVKEYWNKNQTKRIEAADKNWVNIKDKE